MYKISFFAFDGRHWDVIFLSKWQKSYNKHIDDQLWSSLFKFCYGLIQQWQQKLVMDAHVSARSKLAYFIVLLSIYWTSLYVENKMMLTDIGVWLGLNTPKWWDHREGTIRHYFVSDTCIQVIFWPPISFFMNFNLI